MSKRPAFSTRCVHAGEIKDPYGSPHTPIYTTTTFAFDSTAALLDVLEGRRSGGLYTRYGLNPTVLSLEDKLASLEEAEAALAFCSGMAAISAVCMTHGRRGIVCLGDAYGGTMELLASQLPMLGITTHMLLGSELERLGAVLQQGAGMVFFETPTNPTMEIFDIRAISRLAHQYGALVVIDNTFASPVNQQPLRLGADLVLHSATKYLGGHSDITAGALMGSAELVKPVWNWRKNLGQMLAPETAALLARSIRTLEVRVRQQNAAAMAVAQTMRQHPRVARVLYPGLPDFSGYALAAAQMSGFGGMLSLEVVGAGDAATHVVDRLRLFANAPSLGGVESLATQPAVTTHHGLTPAERARRGISDALIRLSIGLEDPTDLIADMEQALA